MQYRIGFIAFSEKVISMSRNNNKKIKKKIATNHNVRILVNRTNSFKEILLEKKEVK